MKELAKHLKYPRLAQNAGVEGIVFVKEKMVSSSHVIKVRLKALKDVIQLIEDYCDEADENNKLFRQGKI